VRGQRYCEVLQDFGALAQRDKVLYALVNQVVETIAGLGVIALAVGKSRPLPSDVLKFDLRYPPLPQCTFPLSSSSLLLEFCSSLRIAARVQRSMDGHSGTPFGRTMGGLPGRFSGRWVLLWQLGWLP
jgi:hypothetical protein